MCYDLTDVHVRTYVLHVHIYTHNLLCIMPFLPQDGGTPLHIASQSGLVDVVQKLLQANAAVDLQSEV